MAQAHGLGHAGGIVGEAVLEVGRHRHVGDGGHDRGGVGDRLVAGHPAVEAAERGGEAAAGGGQRLEAERREQLGRAGVPRVRDQQRLRAGMELEEPFGAVLRGGHGAQRSVQGFRGRWE